MGPARFSLTMTVHWFIVSFTSCSHQLKIYFYMETEKVVLENCQSPYIRNIYTSFKLELSAFTEVVQWIEALTLSSNLFGGSGFESS